jgi:hypothetical protein
VVDISIVLPSCDLYDEGLFTGDAAIEALGWEDVELGFRHPSARSGCREPTAVFWRMVPLETLDEPPRPVDAARVIGYARFFPAW